MLTPEVGEAINKQIENELYGAYVYLSLTIHFDSMALEGFATWMQGQCTEELEHAEKLVRFMRDNDAELSYRNVPKPPQKFDAVLDALQAVVEIEERNTQQIMEIYRLANHNAVHSVEVLMRWFIEQQGVEEKFARQALARARLAGDDRAALLVLDQQFGQGDIE